jgi:hypothetical protein
VSHDGAIFYPGAHSPMWDLAEAPHSIALIEDFYNAGKPVAAVCHARAYSITSVPGPADRASPKSCRASAPKLSARSSKTPWGCARRNYSHFFQRKNTYGPIAAKAISAIAMG